MNLYLLMAGTSYYPDSGTGDWIECFDTHAEALNKVQIIVTFREITRGKRKGERYQERQHYIINGHNYDWFYIIDLKEWIFQ